MLALACITAAAQALAAPRVFEGRLEVRTQQGAACPASQALPYSIPVQARVDDGPSGLVVWGAMAPALVDIASRGADHPIDFLGQSASRGSVALRWNDDDAQGAWREQPPADGTGCSFTEATLHLQPLSGAATAAAGEIGEFLSGMFSAERELHAAASRPAMKAATDRMRELARRLPAASDADAGIADTLLVAGRFALALRPREHALPLFAAASTLYRRHAAEKPEDAALGLLQEARAQRRVAGPPAGEPLLREALDILQRSGHDGGPAASSAHALQGVWSLAAGRADEAASAFGRAADIDERRGAPATERVIALSNLGAALLQGGRPSSAMQILRRALAIAESAPDVPRSLTDGVRSTLDELQESRSLT